MRRQISNHLKTRSQTIRSALSTYNKAAKALDPPREQLNPQKILNMAFISQFDLLRFAREDIRDRAWSLPQNRILTDKYFELRRAQEEIKRLNIEWRRVRTWISDERKLYEKVIPALRNSDPLLAQIVHLRWLEVSKGHAVVLTWLDRTARLDGYTGVLGTGKAVNPRVACVETHDSGSSPNVNDPSTFPCSDEDQEELEDDAFQTGNVDDPETLGRAIDALTRMVI